MANELISVIVPVYGAEAYLDKCVKSIREQQYNNLEIILVDDGSKDRGGIMCDEYKELDGRIKVIHKKNGGLMSAWIEGVKCAAGEYLCFVDSDDYVDTDMILKMQEHMKGGYEIICCNYLIEHQDGRKEPSCHGAAPGEYTGEKLQKEIKEKILGNENRVVTMSRCMKLIKKELIIRNLRFCDIRIKMAEDVNIMLPAILDSERIYVMESSFFYHYYYNDMSMVHHYDRGMNDNMTFLYHALRNIFEEKTKGRDYEPMLEREMLYLFMLQLKNELRSSDGHVISRMLDLIKTMDIKNRCNKYPLKVTDKGNRLLYMLMRYPNCMTAIAVTGAFRLKNR